MNVQHFASEEDAIHRVVERDDGTDHVVDLGPAAAGGAVDVIDETAIVVLDDDQYEIALPDGDSEAFIRNGVLTITQEDSE